MYKHILVALDVDEASYPLLEKATKLANTLNAQISLIHVVEYLPIDPAGEALMPNPLAMEKTRQEKARKTLTTWAQKCNLKDPSIEVSMGSLKKEISDYSKAHHIDLLIAGRHERHGIAMLLGSTEKTLLKSSPCDVLAIILDNSD